MSKSLFYVISLLIFVGQNMFAQMPSAEERSVQLSATVSTDPPQINLTWKEDTGASKYVVYRKSLEAETWGTPIATLQGTATSYTDNNVQKGIGYEYAFFKEDFAPRIDTVCIPAGTQVNFTINDMYNIGLCCSFGFGSYQVKNCDFVMAEGDDFGMSNSHVFTTCEDGSGCSEVVITMKTDMFENSTSWVLTNNNTGAILGSSGPVGSFVKPRPEYGFIYAGIELPEVESRGKILLLVENGLATPLANEIAQLERDYIGDGWQVLKEEVSANDSPTNVRLLVQSMYTQHSDLNAVFLLGHIPIPFSGDIFPDTHSELRGAYAADVYYGEMNGTWTDATVNNTTANFDIYHNIPGDGKFDQDSIPTGVVELQVGRVDFFDMPSFASSNEILIQQYLNKNHSFKTRQINPIRRALIDDNFMQSFAAPAASGFRNFAPMFGADSIFQLDYLSAMENESYLWSYGCGGGSITSSQGIGNTSDFVTSNLQNVFTMLFGSQFGNWAYPDDFLRAPLASGQTLTNVWAGSPPWTFHHMAMGHNIGYSTLKTQNGSGELYLGNGPQLVHVALMGDPSLRMHMVAPSTKITFDDDGSSIDLTWDEPENEDIIGYHLYRADSLHGKFERLNADVITDTFYTDSNPIAGENWYMVRTLKLENSASGSYYNLSIGRIDSVFFMPAIALAANFSTTTQEYCVEDIIQFNDNSAGTIATYNWTFEGGDPMTSDLQNPEVTYNTTGTFDVTLTINNVFGESTESKSGYIVIEDVPVPDFDFTIDNGLLQITDNTNNADFYFWDFGDGNSSQIDGDVTYNYSTPGVYTITLTASNGCGANVFQQTVNVMTTSLENIILENKISVFPNPTSELLMIDFGENINNELNIELIDILGRVVFFKKIENPKKIEELNLASFSKGIYFFKMADEKSKIVKRILVE